MMIKACLVTVTFCARTCTEIRREIQPNFRYGHWCHQVREALAETLASLPPPPVTIRSPSDFRYVFIGTQ